MSRNDQVLVRQLVEQNRNAVAPNLSESEYFVIFSAEQSLKDRDLSYDEIEDGIVDGAGDGGIDAMYLFVNNTLCRETVNYEEYKRNVPVELVFIQAKRSQGFSEKGLDRFIASANELLDLSQDPKTFFSVYNADLVTKIQVFRESYMQLTSKFPILTVRYFYSTLAEDVHPNVERKVENLQKTVSSNFTPVNFSFEFLSASRLLALARQTPTTVRQLRLAESPISTGQSAYVCLTTLTDYFSFISDDRHLNERIFEGNVRDYQGKTEINQKIRDTLTGSFNEDFWWLNNGISVLCAHASVSGKTLTIENPEIVNGLQTSREIFDVLSSRPEPTDQRAVLVRVIVPEKEESRDRIIRATNRNL